MNGRRRVFLNLLLAVVIGSACCSWVAGAAAGLPADVRTSGNAGAIKAQVEKFITEQVGALTGDDPTAISAARELLIAQVVQATSAAPAPSPAFLSVYADVLNTALANGPAKDPNVRVRLNAAIIAAKVAERANNSQLVPVVVTLLGDQNEAVVLWAVKASKFLIPPLLGNVAAAKGNALGPALLGAVKKNVKSPSVVAAAYDALQVSDKGNNAVVAGSWPQVVPVVVDALHQIMEARIKLYETGIPPGAASDANAIYFLTSSNVWNLKGADAAKQQAQRFRTVQLMSDLMGSIKQRLAAANPVQRDEMYEALKRVASGFSVISEELAKDENVKKLYQMTKTTDPNVVIGMCDSVFAAVKKIPEFSKITPPAPLSAIPAATTGEASPPTTAP